MKSILISIKPKWAAKIINGDKIVEIRKTAPKCDLPVEVYIYCAKGKELHLRHFESPFYPCEGDSVHCFWEKFELAYFAGKEDEILPDDSQRRNETDDHINGKVVAKFTLERVDDIGRYAYAYKDGFFYITLNEACLTPKDLAKYAPVSRFEWERKGMKLYAWRISDLKIFDRPKDLSEFGLKRAPQSWQYVGEIKKGEE